MKDTKIISLLSVCLGLLCVASTIGEIRWYIVLCFASLGVMVALSGLYHFFNAAKYVSIRGQSWFDFIIGVSVLIMAVSDFYRPQTLSVVVYISSVGLIAVSIWGLVLAVKKYDLTIIP